MIKEYLSKYKEDFENCKKDFSNIKTWYKQIPNMLNISRPLCMIPANILFFTGNVIPAVILTGLLLITDFFDGKLARKWNVQSKLGADLDAVGDKVMFLGMLLPLLVNYPVMIINVLGELAIASVNISGRIKGLDTKTVFTGKIKTWLLSITLGMGYLVQFFHLPVSILRVLTVLTGFSQGVALENYIVEYNQMLDKKSDEEIYNKCNDDIIFENLSDEEQDNLLEMLEKEREFVLSTLESGKVYTGKRKVRIKLQEKRTIN